MSALESPWEFLRPWERVFLIVWFLLLVQAPIVIGVVILGGYAGWWKT